MNLGKEKLTTQDAWSHRKGGIVDSILFEDLFLKYLEKIENKICLEIGCVPGKFLSYISKNFGYFPEGIDYITGTKQITEETLKLNNIHQYNIYESDFTIWNSPKQYDLVCSFGFIEHFTGDLERKIIKSHIDLLKPGGKLILDVPNFRFGQYFIHFLLNRENLKKHNLKIMKLSYFTMVAKENNLKIIHLGFYGGFFEFWSANNLNLIRKIIFRVLKIIEKIIKKTPLKSFNNCFFSPYIVFIAEKQIG